MLKLNNNKLLIGILIGIMFSTLTIKLQMLLFLNGYLIFLSLILIELIIFKNSTGYKNMNILEVKYDKNMRCLTIVLNNSNLLEGKDLFEAIFTSITSNEIFQNFGNKKIMILSAVLETNKEHNLHSNILIENTTTFEEYYEEISYDLNNFYNLEYGYGDETIIRYIVKLWNCDLKENIKIKMTHDATKAGKPFNEYKKSLGIYELGKKLDWEINNKANTRSYSTSSTLHKHWAPSLIPPLSLVNKKGELKLSSPRPFYTMDIETVNLNGLQIPIAISSCGPNSESKIFLINYNLLQINSELALKQLWENYFNYLENLDVEDKVTIFAHNLGDFYGYFLYKGLMNHYNPDKISSIIDESNSFISIICNNGVKFEWKDSLRIFPISLNELCKIFGVEGKTTECNIKYNDMKFLEIPKLVYSFKKYSLQDSVSLYNALFIAQLFYFKKFGVDIESIYSTSTLALKFYRNIKYIP